MIYVKQIAALLKLKRHRKPIATPTPHTRFLSAMHYLDQLEAIVLATVFHVAVRSPVIIRSFQKHSTRGRRRLISGRPTVKAAADRDDGEVARYQVRKQVRGCQLSSIIRDRVLEHVSLRSSPVTHDAAGAGRTSTPETIGANRRTVNTRLSRFDFMTATFAHQATNEANSRIPELTHRGARACGGFARPMLLFWLFKNILFSHGPTTVARLPERNVA